MFKFSQFIQRIHESLWNVHEYPWSSSEAHAQLQEDQPRNRDRAEELRNFRKILQRQGTRWRTSARPSSPFPARRAPCFFALFFYRITSSLDLFESPHSALTFYISFYLFLYLSWMFHDVSAFFCISWIPNQRSWLRCCDTHLRPLPRRRNVARSIEKRRNRTRNRTNWTTPTFSSRWLGCAASFGSLCEAQHLASQNPKKWNATKYEWNALKCNNILQNLGRSETKKKVLLFFLARQLALRQRELCSREGAASSRPGFRMRLEISLIESLYIFVCLLTWYSSSSSSIHHVYHFYGALFDVFDAYWLDSGLVVPALWIAQSARMAHGRWVCALDQPAWATWLKNSSWIQRQAWNFMKSSSTNITESHPSEWQQIYATMQQRCIRFDQSSALDPPRHSRPSNRQRKGAGTSASKARRSWVFGLEDMDFLIFIQSVDFLRLQVCQPFSSASFSRLLGRDIAQKMFASFQNCSESVARPPWVFAGQWDKTFKLFLCMASLEHSIWRITKKCLQTLKT